MLLYAYDENENIIPISKAEKKINYYCPECGSILRVKDGEKKCKHYFHLNVEDCGATGESLAHKYFKEHLTDFIDEIIIEYNDILETDVEVYKIVSFETEQRLTTSDGETLIPDIIATTDSNEQVAIEVFYKHKKDEIAVNKYRKMNLPCVEIEIDIEMNILNIRLLYTPKEKRKEKFYKILNTINASYSLDEIEFFIQELVKKKKREIQKKKEKEEREILTKQLQSGLYYVLEQRKKELQTLNKLVITGKPLIFYNPYNDKEVCNNDFIVVKDEKNKYQIIDTTGTELKFVKRSAYNGYYAWYIDKYWIYELDLSAMKYKFKNRKEFVEELLKFDIRESFDKIIRMYFSNEKNLIDRIMAELEKNYDEECKTASDYVLAHYIFDIKVNRPRKKNSAIRFIENFINSQSTKH